MFLPLSKRFVYSDRDLRSLELTMAGGDDHKVRIHSHMEMVHAEFCPRYVHVNRGIYPDEAATCRCDPRLMRSIHAHDGRGLSLMGEPVGHWNMGLERPGSLEDC